MRMSVLMYLVLAGAAAPLSGQAAATVCKDGSTSAASGRGACSAHGGVDRKASKAAKKAEKAEEKAAVKEAKSTGAMIACTDGSQSKPGRGACGHHGGIRVAGGVAPAPQQPAAVPPTSSAPTRPHVAREAAKASSHRGEDADPTGAIAQCKDGMYSHASNRRGACSRHKGVAKWM